MSEQKLAWQTGTVKLKDCPQCGHKTRRDFCTPQCRMEDSDNRIEGIEEENKRMRVALEEIANHYEEEISFDDCYMEVKVIAKEALNNGTITLRE